MHKRKEHRLSSWVVYVDLIKAFDLVSRESMYKVLSKLGVPENLVDLIIRLHTNCIVKIRAGDSDVTVESTAGVKQGDSLAPVLFSLYFQACMEVLADQWVFEKPLFAYKLDNVLTGRKYNVKPDAYFEFYR